jgi:hypothetical protein
MAQSLLKLGKLEDFTAVIGLRERGLSKDVFYLLNNEAHGNFEVELASYAQLLVSLRSTLSDCRYRWKHVPVVKGKR